jgi:hypothetical protein
MIEVKRHSDGDPLKFEVIVCEGKGEMYHHVTMTQATCDRLRAGKHAPERCLEAAFRFLLDRESKESILAHFDVTIISRYFL